MSAVLFDGVGKHYRLGSEHRSLRGLLSGIIDGGAEEAEAGLDLWALRNVSFTVEKGETVGLIGSNGAGKTTSLKLMSRVIWPTEGRVDTDGRVAALIELGAGFHPELTGRENVFLNGAILGMSQSEIRRQYPNIVTFAELERFMDTPVKRYSSGMFARLGFSVAAHVDPDVLLVDEVLAVGDVNFQRKCHEYIHAFVRSGRTTIFVSHNLYALEQLCDRLIWLEKGIVVVTGNAREVLTAYMDAQDRKLHEIERDMSTDSDLVIEYVETCDASNQARDSFMPGEDVVVRVTCRTKRSITQPHFVLAVWDATTRQPLIMASMLVDGQTPAEIGERGTLACRFTAPPLLPRTYHVWGEVYGADRQTLLLRWQPLAAFTINATMGRDATDSLRHVRADAPIRVDYDWTYS